jgi:hypothetical protein
MPYKNGAVHSVYHQLNSEKKINTYLNKLSELGWQPSISVVARPQKNYIFSSSQFMGAYVIAAFLGCRGIVFTTIIRIK